MTRFMTAYFCPVNETDRVEAFTEDEDWQAAQDEADDYVWQFAPDRETAIRQHFIKLDEWEADPTQETY